MRGRKQADQSYLIGEKVGRLTIFDVFRDAPCGRTIILCKCKCDCGKETIVSKGNLLTGSIKSCGCLQKEKQHNQSRTRIYSIYRGMKQRCYNPTCSIYNKYGNRGISICDDWMGDNGFLNFYEWSKNHGYSDNLSIDRIDPQKGYSPDNCRWATSKEQNTHLSMPKTNTSGVLGVSWSKKEKRWLAVISLNNKTKRIGSFKTKEEAANARNEFIEQNNLPHQLSILTA